MRIPGRVFCALVFSILITSFLIAGCDSSGGSSGSPSHPSPRSLENSTQPKAGASPAAPAAQPSLATDLGILPAVDLRANDSPVMEQFGGTCQTFATAAAMDNVLKSKGIHQLVSERDLWNLNGVYDVDNAVDAAANNFVDSEQVWPVADAFAPSGFAQSAEIKITQYQAHDYDMNAALQGLSAGHPAVMAIQVPQSMDDCDTMVDATSRATKGQHVLEVSGYQLDDSVAGGGYFILKNSWGTDCGDHGYQYYPFALCARDDLYCYFIEIDDVVASNSGL